MKIRNGFVSNSSASSFLIYGIEIDSEELFKMMKKTHPQEVKELYEDDDADDIDDGEGAYDLFEKLVPYDYNDKDRLSYDSPDSGTVYLGRSWDQVKDDETGKQFKERTVADIRKLIGDKKVKFDTHEFAWMPS